MRDLSRSTWVVIIVQALCAGAFFNLLLLLGMKFTSASMAGIITSALPAIVVIASIVFLKERLTRRAGLSIGLAILGLIIINARNLHLEQSDHFLGDMIILLSLIPEAAYYILSKLHQNKLPVFLVSALMNGINVPVFCLILIFHQHPISLNLHAFQCVLLLIVGIASALFYVFWFLGSRKVHSTAAGLTTAFMPIATLIIATLFLKETISNVQFIGMLLVILSIVYSSKIQQAML